MTIGGRVRDRRTRASESGEDKCVEGSRDPEQNACVSDASRFVDRLPVGAPYDGVVALAYDTWMPPGTRFPDDAFHADVVRGASGSSLELGVGNGRFLIPLVEAGLRLEGIDSSADMLDRCRRHAAARGLDVVLHRGDIAPLDLGRRFGALVCPAGSFTLVADELRARAALASYLDHLEPGGTLALTMFVPGPDDTTGFSWRLRRTGTDADGTSYVVHEATGDDVEAQVHLVFNRLETFDASGALIDTVLRKMRLRWWPQTQLAEALGAAGFVDIEAIGDSNAWIAVARRP
jgi:trans-aconitate methyltransferase